MAKMTFDPDAYTITIRRENVDGEFLFVGNVAEFPNISAYEETYDQAREILLDAITSLKTIADEEKKEFPSPLPYISEEYSGRQSLRLPRSLHAKAAKLAHRDGVSLNYYIGTALAAYIGESEGLSIAYKEMAKNVNAAIYMMTRTATQFISSVSMNYLQTQQGSSQATYPYVSLSKNLLLREGT